MKNILIALAAVAATGTALAQSTVTISGGVAAAYERSTKAGQDAGITGHEASVNNLTFKGTEDLGGGLKISFELNKRFNLANGAGYGGREFENSFITVSGAFGALRMGRHQPISVAAFDAFAALGVDFGLGNGVSAYTDYGYNNMAASRYNDAISYETPKFNGFSAIIATTASPDVNTGRENVAFRLGYASGPLSVAYVQERVATKVGAAERDDKNLGASYDFGVVKALLLWGQAGNADARTAIGAIVPVGSNVKLKGTYRTKGVGNDAKTASTEALAFGADYSLSKRTTLFADFGTYKDAAQSAYRVGVRHQF